MNCRLVVIERVSDGTREFFHSVGRVFKEFSLKDALDLGDERVHVVVGIATDFVFV